METESFALYSQPGKQNLEISWDGGAWHVRGNIQVRFEGTVLRVFEKREDLYQAQDVHIPGHPSISIYLKDGKFEIRQQGRLITHERARSPKEKLKDFYDWLHWYSIFMLIFSSLPIILKPFPDLSKDMPFQPYIVLPAILLAVIALVLIRFGDLLSIWRLRIVALSMFVTFILMFVVYPLNNTEFPSFFGIYLAGLVVYSFIKAIQARRTLLKNELPS